jgi:hypothetical protein
LRFFHFNQYQKQRLVRGDIIQWLVALKFHRLCVLDLIDQKMFCFGIDGVNEITNVPSYKYHKHFFSILINIKSNGWCVAILSNVLVR